MTAIAVPRPPKIPLPDHTQLPDRDGVPVHNCLEPWLSALLSQTLEPVLCALFPQGNYFIGQDNGIYWERTNPPNLGCKSLDWYLVPNVPPLLDGILRRSYVLWQELVPPLVLLEYASADGAEERDRTPKQGKFWTYERRIRPAFYGIFLPEQGIVEMHQLVEDRFARMAPNASGRFPIASLGVELGIWKGKFGPYDISWMRWWNAAGKLLPTAHEIAEQEKQRAEQEKQRADVLAAKLRDLGIDPNLL